MSAYWPRPRPRPSLPASPFSRRRSPLPIDAWLGIAALACMIVLADLAAAVWLRGPAGLSSVYLPRTLLVFGIGAALAVRSWRNQAEPPGAADRAVAATSPSVSDRAAAGASVAASAASTAAPVASAHSPRFGPANLITLLRLALVACLAGLIGEAADPLLWGVVLVASVSALLDGVDGAVARSTGFASPFGARFDMETDALLVLVLSALAWQSGKAGWWVLASGLMRYFYVAAGRLWPWLRREVLPSWRRKAICVLQIVLLILVISPAVALPWSTGLAGLGLLLLTWSFAIDIAYLHGRRP